MFIAKYEVEYRLYIEDFLNEVCGENTYRGVVFFSKTLQGRERSLFSYIHQTIRYHFNKTMIHWRENPKLFQLFFLIFIQNY